MSYALNEKTWLALLVPDLYPWILAGVCFNCALANFYGFAAAGKRGSTFTPEFMAQFAEEHKKAYPEGPASDLDKGGNPDQGTGWYSNQLPLREWAIFNQAQRVYLNYVEQLPIICLTAPIGGLYVPIPTLVFIWTFAFGRMLYGCGYMSEGKPIMRGCGGCISALCVAGLITVALMSAIWLTMYAAKEKQDHDMNIMKMKAGIATLQKSLAK